MQIRGMEVITLRKTWAIHDTTRSFWKLFVTRNIYLISFEIANDFTYVYSYVEWTISAGSGRINIAFVDLFTVRN